MATYCWRTTAWNGPRWARRWPARRADLLPRPAEILDVAELESSLPPPRFLLFLPQPDRGERPRNSRGANGCGNRTAASARRRRRPAGRAAAAALARATARSKYFVEHGWNHPLPEAASCTPTPTRRPPRPSLTAEAAEARRTHWTILAERPAAAHCPPHCAGGEAVALRADGTGRRPHDRCAVGAPARSRWRFDAAPAPPTGGGRADQARRLDKRIQEVQHQLFTLQLRRQALGRRATRRVRLLLLRFRQPAGGELAAPFRRFLEMAWGRRGDLEYCFQDLPGGGWHVIRTREPAAERALPHGLADDAWYQPEEWGDDPFEVLLRLDCEACRRPSTGARRTAARRGAARRRGARGGRRRRAARGAAGAGRADRPDAHRPAAAGGGDAGGATEPVHADFPASQGPTRAAAREDMLRTLRDRAADFETEIEAVERRLVGEADARLREARRLWNEIAGRIADDLRGVEACGERTAVFAAMLSDFRASWQGFVAHVLAVNDGLIASKLRALDELERSRQEWRAALDRVAAGDEDVNRRLEPADREIKDRLSQAQARREEVRTAFGRVAEAERAAAERLTAAVRECETWLAGARAAHQTVEAADRSLAERRGQAGTLLAAAVAGAERLRASVDGFRDLIRRIGEACETARRTADQLAALHADLPARRRVWEETFAASQSRLAGVQGHATRRRRRSTVCVGRRRRGRAAPPRCGRRSNRARPRWRSGATRPACCWRGRRRPGGDWRPSRRSSARSWVG